MPKSWWIFLLSDRHTLTGNESWPIAGFYCTWLFMTAPVATPSDLPNMHLLDCNSQGNYSLWVSCGQKYILSSWKKVRSSNSLLHMHADSFLVMYNAKSMTHDEMLVLVSVVCYSPTYLTQNRLIYGWQQFSLLQKGKWNTQFWSAKSALTSASHLTPQSLWCS